MARARRPAARTSAAWWNEIRSNPEALLRWLRKQYHGEATAAERIERYCIARLPADDPRRRILAVVAGQERQHAHWVGDLLRARGEEPRILTRRERYWTHALAAMTSFEDAAGIAHHAEVMRLERIEVIASDPTAPDDIRATFARILRDERFHARAFARLAGSDGVRRTRSRHEDGARAIGFVRAAEAA